VYSNHGAAFGYHQIDIVCDDGTRDFYAHLTTRTPANGARVDAGQALGKVGAEGNVTGAHLHFERHATDYGGWSCAVVRDPAPSINYQPAGGSGGSGASGGQDEEMPEYTQAKASKNVTLRDGEWNAIEWDGSNDPDYFDGYGILIGGCRYSVTVSLHIKDRQGAVVDVGYVETDDAEPVEESPDYVLGAFDHTGDTHNGAVANGRRLRVRTRVRGGDATLVHANIAVLAFRP
jgi:murein DD-endopeptidase MepM/ murein hydrolase activator NlpD